jgi:phosphoribosylanthranilate isomerase
LRVKICGITNAEDLEAAVEAGADLLGFNFVAGPRKLDISAARDILPHVPLTVTPVALVRIEHGKIATALADLLSEFAITHVQLYGQVDAGAVENLLGAGWHPMQVVRVADESFAAQTGSWSAASRPKAVVLDAYDPKQAGGTGKAFCWDWVVEARQGGQLDHWPPIFLAGGLNPDNVAEAVKAVQPFGVDVSSGVEVPNQPGKKDLQRMRVFVQRAWAAANRTT